MPVDTQRQDVKEMSPKWKRMRDCTSGRDAVLAAGEAYVPSLPAKDAAENEAYRRRGNFYNATQRTVQGMVGAIFQEAPDVSVPANIEPYLTDVTLSNIPFEMFAQEAGREVMITARYGVLVDMPVSPDPKNRPYCVGYKAEHIVNWRTARIAGVETLILLVLRECVEQAVSGDAFAMENVEQYRVIRLTAEGCTVELWREKSKGDKTYVVYQGASLLIRRGEPVPFIPFTFICAKNATPDIEEPPLIDLADVNLGHWRNSVDHEYGLHLVALPTPWVSGSKAPGNSSDPLPIGPSKVWELETNGQAGMLEFSGKGLEAIVTAMEEKKKQMAALGGRLLEDSAVVQETASAVRMRHAGEHASLKTIAQSLEVGFTLVLQTMTWWAGTDAVLTEAKASVELNKEYLNVKATAPEVTAMLTALQANEISFETWYNFLEVGGYTREEVTAEEELTLVQKQKQAVHDAALAIAAIRPPQPNPNPVPGPGGAGV